MKLAWKVSLCLNTALSVTAFPALAGDVDLTGRTVLVDRQGPRLRGPHGPAWAFSATLDAPAASDHYALHLEGDLDPDAIRIRINGRTLDQDPAGSVRVGLWYQVPPALLVVGENSFAIESRDGSPLDLTLIRAFSLVDSAEEAHFDRMFGDPVRWTQPATDPLQDLMDVEHIDLALNLPMTGATITSGVMTMTARSLTGGLTECVLDFNDNGGLMTVSSVDTGPPSFTPLTHSWDTANERLRITLSPPAPLNATFTVRVSYSGSPNNSPPSYGAGVFGQPFRYTTHGSSVPLLYTFNEPYRARVWFPCKDIPEDKFTIDLHVTVPDASYGGFPLSVVSNGALVSNIDNGATRTFNWSEGFPLSSYLVSICCTNYRAASGTYTALDNVTTMEVAHHVYPENFASESPEVPNTITVMEFFADTFGEYPFLTEKYWTASHGSGSGMEHQTATSMPALNLATPFHRRNIHELAHMWFGDLITNNHFDHLWIQEGWATYCEALFYEFQSGTAAYHAYVDAWTTSDAVPIVSDDGDEFNNSIVYRKGAWVLHMLRRVLGDTAFFQGARNYIADPALRYGTANSEDVERNFETAAGQQLDWYFDQWLLRAARPNYTWNWSTHTAGPDTYVDIDLLQTQSGGTYVMPIDFRVDFSGGGTADFTVNNTMAAQSFSVNVGPGTVTDVTFDPDNWLLDFNTEGPIPAPAAPTLLSVTGNGATGNVTVRWLQSTDPSATGYRLYRSPNGTSGWTLVADESTLTLATTQHVAGGFSAWDTAHFQLTAVGTGESAPSDVYSVRVGPGAASLLIVDAYDRWNTQAFSGGLNHAIAAMHGRAVAAYGTPFDTCANEEVGGMFSLGSYEVVDWICGDESTVHETFSAAEQTLVSAYLEGGGKLLVSGNEIGWDLDRPSGPTGADRAFYNNYLRADYVADDSNDYTVTGTGGSSAFTSHAFSYGSGGDSPYHPDFPDVVAAVSSTPAIEYSPGVIAGIQYSGTFGASATPGMLVHLGFAFETINSEPQRIQAMDDVLSWFGASVPAGVVLLGAD